MSKKDKKIEIQLTDAKVSLENQQVEGVELSVGKRVIGSIVELDGKFATVANSKVGAFYKTLDQAVTAIVESYNLNH